MSDAQQTCRECGCTDERACQGADGDPCCWVAPDLCSACLKKMIPAEDYDRTMELLRLQTIDVPVTLNGVQAFQLLAALQLVLRHPTWTGPARDFVEQLARGVQEQISISPTIATMCEEGWWEAPDVPAEIKERKSGLILPPGYE